LTGAVSLTANAASSFTTSAGALTITSAAAATWSTGAGTLDLRGFTGITLRGGSTTALTVNTAGTIVTFSADTSAQFAESAADPTTAANQGAIYTKNVGPGNTTELFFRSDTSGVVTQLTPQSATSASQVVQTGFTTNTTDLQVTSGLFGYLSGTANQVLKAVATSYAVACATIGANEGTVGSMTTHGTIEGMKAEPGITVVAGDCLYLSVATGNGIGTGSATDVAPIDVGQVVLLIGVARTAMTGDHTGTNSAFSLSGNTITLTAATGTFVSGDVGRVIRIASANTAGNNGYFIIASFISGTQVTYVNAGGATDAVVAGTWSVGGSFDMVLKVGHPVLL
jgi:hypothetical protein